MDAQAKEFMVHALRKEFIAFMQNVAKIPGSHVQKQQAFLRFDEGHMWMQNAVLSYVAPQAETPAPEADPAPQPELQAEISPDDIKAELENVIEGTENQVMQPDGQPIVSPAE